ncbi:MAG: ribosome-associated translation inhibitor RaiA [Phycisphaerae bacterium]|nr:ribosome-associated translation inhibitor RaiA [Phycisphaerae bacterium]
MQVVITARHFDLTPEMKDRIESKASRLLKHYNRVQQINVVVEKQAAAFTVEMIVNAEHKTEFVAKVADGEAYAALDSVVDKLERQLSDHKERFRNRKHPPQ